MAKKPIWVKKFGRPGASYPVYLEVVESPAYRSLRPLARCVLEEFLILNRQAQQNGRLNLPVAKAAGRLGVCENTVRPAYYELMERGFLDLTAGAVYEERLSRLWRITFLPVDGREPTDEWRHWKPGQPIITIRKNKTTPQKLRQAASKIAQDSRNN